MDQKQLTIKIISAFVLLTILTSVLSSCSNSSAVGLADKACGYVDKSNTYYQLAIKTDNTSKKQIFLNKALVELRTALPYAAQAGYEDSDLQALSADLSESSRVPVANLLPSLLKECYQITQH